MDLRIQSVHFDADDKLKEYIKAKISKVETFYDRIIDAEVILKLENSGQVRDKIVECKVNVPGDTFFVKEVDKTFEAAVDKTSDVMGRQIRKFKERIRQHH